MLRTPVDHIREAILYFLKAPKPRRAIGVFRLKGYVILISLLYLMEYQFDFARIGIAHKPAHYLRAHRTVYLHLAVPKVQKATTFV